MIGGPSTLRECGTPKSRDDDVIVEYSVNAGKSVSAYRVMQEKADQIFHKVA